MPALTRKRAASTVSKRARSSTRAVVPDANARSLSIPRGVPASRSGFPIQMFMKHTFVFPLTSTTAVPGATWRLSVNSLYDPSAGDTALGNTQPLYFDQMKLLYARYVVLSSTCVCELQGSTSPGAGAEGGYSVMYIEDNSTDVSNFVTAAEQPTATSIKLYSYQQKARHVIKWDARKAFGGNAMDSSGLKGTATASPTEQQFYTVYRASPSGSASPVVGYMRVTYNAVWSELLPVSDLGA